MALMHAPEIKLPQPSPSEYQQAIAGKEQKLVWYKFNKALPNVNPARAKAEARPVRAELRARQQIVASPKNAPKRTQIVCGCAETAGNRSVGIAERTGREVAGNADTGEASSQSFVPPEMVQPETGESGDAAGRARDHRTNADAVALPTPKFVKPFVPPPKKVPVKLTEVAPAPEVPVLAAAVKTDPTVADYKFKLPPRPFTPPQREPSVGQANCR